MYISARSSTSYNSTTCRILRVQLSIVSTESGSIGENDQRHGDGIGDNDQRHGDGNIAVGSPPGGWYSVEYLKRFFINT